MVFCPSPSTTVAAEISTYMDDMESKIAKRRDGVQIDGQLGAGHGV